ncbi:MAG: hydroxymethylbilane synthase [Zoogloeaceae bacterium]|jgi:hydroxymethylbilane synthase|nr:hydroxymethylbilane synthase [Zoogloeaceae bacterium]
MSPPAHIVIASRESRLALWQAGHIRNRLAELHPGARIEILGISTKGDRILDRPLAEIGGKGLFIKELEAALAEGRAHLAVHSMKDMPMEMPDGFSIAAICARADPRDAFVSNRHASLAALPAKAVVGTSSLRREALLRNRYPHLVIRSLRGNLETRLKKLDDGQYDAIILAAAGLTRLGLAGRIRALISPEESLPAPGQGALGIEILDGADPDIRHWTTPLGDPETTCCVQAERAFSRALGGSCQVPLGGYAVLRGEQLWLRGFVASPDGRDKAEGEILGGPQMAEDLGRQLAERLKARGADAILARLAQAR